MKPAKKKVSSHDLFVSKGGTQKNPIWATELKPGKSLAEHDTMVDWKGFRIPNSWIVIKLITSDMITIQPTEFPETQKQRCQAPTIFTRWFCYIHRGKKIPGPNMAKPKSGVKL
jgi:hypothetical protein